MTRSTAAKPWDQDQTITLWHGTNVAGARNIVKHGIDPEFFTVGCDFGFGFYTGTTRAQAQWWATRGRRPSYRLDGETDDERAALVRLELPLAVLAAEFHTLAFVRAIDESRFWPFTDSCRGLLRERMTHLRPPRDSTKQLPKGRNTHSHGNNEPCYDIVIGPMSDPNRPRTRWVVNGQDWDQYAFCSQAVIEWLNHGGLRFYEEAP